MRTEILIRNSKARPASLGSITAAPQGYVARNPNGEYVWHSESLEEAEESLRDAWRRREFHEHIRLSAAQWQLYSMPEAEGVATRMNTVFNALTAVNADRDLITDTMLGLASCYEYRRVGASDTEPRNVLWKLLDDIYGPVPRLNKEEEA